MPTGYVRQDTTGQLANGNPIDADLFNDEYNAIVNAFNASTGHSHDGTTGGGAPILKLGASNELEVDASAVFPKLDNLIDLGKTTKQWRDGHFGRTVYIGDDLSVTDDATIGGDLTVTGNATINGNLTLGDAATDNVSFGADINSHIIPNTDDTFDLGSTTQEWRNIYIDGIAYLDEVDIDAGAIDGAAIGANSASTGAFTTLAASGATGIDGDFDINTNKFTVAASSGNTAIAGTLAVTGVSTMTGAINANGGVVGDLTGDVTGNLTGNVTSSGTSALTTVNVSDTFTANGNTVLGNAATDTVTFNADVASNIIPSADSTYTLGDSSNYWSHGYIDAVTTTGNATIGGNAVITGDLTVQGTTTTVNSTTVDVADLNITVASGAASSGAANGGGLTVGGAGATFTYTSSDDRWNMNKELTVGRVHGNVTGDVTGDLTGNVTSTGTSTFSTVDINGGAIDGTTIGAASASSGIFTTLRFNTNITDGTTTITGFVDEDNMSSNSAALVPTQQSVKAYVDAQVQGDSSSDFSAASIDATELDLNGGNGSGWVIYQSGTDLKFKYNGTDRFKLSSAGALVVENDVTAFGAA